VEDTTNDPTIRPRTVGQSWNTWQLFENYYNDGALVWLEIDMLIRDLSSGKRSLDDFAKSFFGIDNGSFATVTYSFDDIVNALNAVQPYTWADLLHKRIYQRGQTSPDEALLKGGYQLVFTDKPGDLIKSFESGMKGTLCTYSIGISFDKDGKLTDVVWDGPAFKAGLAEGMQIISVNGTAFSPEELTEAIADTKEASKSIELIVKNGNEVRTAAIRYQGGLKYPHLERVDKVPVAHLDDTLKAK
jgi:predicted metalloprotease with PDZ domain